MTVTVAPTARRTVAQLASDYRSSARRLRDLAAPSKTEKAATTAARARREGELAAVLAELGRGTSLAHALTDEHRLAAEVKRARAAGQETTRREQRLVVLKGKVARLVADRG